MVLLVAGAIWLAGAVHRHSERDLRDLDALAVARAVAVEVDTTKGPDWVTVRFHAHGQPVEADVRMNGAVRVGDEVTVAYVPAEPRRVRSVHRWSSTSGDWFVVAASAALVGLWFCAVGLARLVRGGEVEAKVGDPVRPGPLDELGERILTGPERSWLRPLGRRRSPDGVWVKDEGLVSRWRGTERLWRWETLEALRFVHENRTAEIKAFVGVDTVDEATPRAWETEMVARVRAGTARRWHAYRRLHEVARQHGVPLY